MKATHFEFRFRMAIITAVIVLGFWSPWIQWLGIGSRISLLESLALELSRLGLLSFTASAPVVIVVAALLAAIAAVLRVWGTAYLGAATVQHSQMQAGAVMADGPYRYVRNPLYIGTWFMLSAMSFAMPATGAALVMVVLSIFQLRLIFAEEAFLQAKLGPPYEAYLNAVPRLAPRLRGAPTATGAKPRWMRSVLSELNPIGVFVTLAVFSWSYNHWVMVKAIVISFGLSLVVRAFLPESDS
jgi:protein-S-isoprenylcysteine O-methyltransferase Ste14